MSWNLWLSCLAALAGMQASAWLLARGLGRRLPGRIVALGLALPIVVLSPFLFGHDLLVPTGTLDRVLPIAPAGAGHATHLLMSDSTYQFLPWELEVRHAFKERRLPLWSDRLGGGGSPWANPQAAVLSPIAMLARAAPIQHFLLVALALKILLAFEGTWLLARRLGASRVAAVLAAASFAVGGGVLSWSLFPHSATVAWVPWLTLGCIELLRRPRALTLATTAVLFAALLLAGHPETAFAGGLFAAFCALGLCRRGERRGRRRPGFARGFGAAALAACLGFGLAAPQVLPFLRAVPGSQRTRDMLAGGVQPHLFTPLAPSSWFLPTTLAYLRAPISPRAFGVPYGGPFDGPFDWVDALSGYAGLVAFAGAVVALLALRDRRTWPFLAFAVMAMLLVAGFLPFAWLIDAVPLLRVPVYPRLLPVVCLALAVAAAFGCDLLLRGAARQSGAAVRRGRGRFSSRIDGRRWQVAAALGAAGAISLAAGRTPEIVAAWLLIAGAPLAAARHRGVGAALLLAALALDLGPWAQRLLPHGEATLFYPPNPLTAKLVTESAGGPWRTLGMDLLVYPSLLPAYGLDEVRPNDPLAPSDYLRVLRLAFGFDPTAANYYARMRTVDHPLLSFLNVRTVVGNLYLRPPGLPVVPLTGAGTFLLFHNAAALPRWFVPSAVDAIEPTGLDAWIAGMKDPGRVAVYRDEAAAAERALARSGTAGGASGEGAEGAAEASAPGTVGGPAAVRGATVIAATPGHLQLAVPGRGPRLLATSLPLPAGWSASWRGRRLPTLTVDGAFLGVAVPGEVSRVELRFSPPGFRLGLVLGGMSSAALLLLLAWSGRGLRLSL